MSFAEMLEEIPKLTVEQRQELVERVLELDADGDLTPEEDALLDERMEDLRKNPDAEMSFEEFKQRAMARLRGR